MNTDRLRPTAVHRPVVRPGRVLVALAAALICALVPGSAGAQQVFDVLEPLFDGERSLRFIVAHDETAAEDVHVTVAYATHLSAFTPGMGGTLYSGKPVLMRMSSGRLEARFVFTHPHHPSTPNAALYRHLVNRFGATVVRYPELEGGAFAFPVLQIESNAIDMVVPSVPIEPDQCVYYRITVTAGTTNTTPIDSFRMPGRFAVGLVGDSYSSGEGAPDDPADGNNSNMWQDADCHRSNKSGLVRGVKRFISRNPEASISWVHRACSGAVLGDLDDQIRDVSDTFRDRGSDRVHALLFSIGGNDLGFADYVVDYLYHPMGVLQDIWWTPLDELAEILENMEEDLNGLDEQYRTGLSEFIDGFQEIPPLVGMCTYPNPTRGPWGFCASHPYLPQLANYTCCPWEVGPSNPPSDYEIMSGSFVDPLNRLIRSTVEDQNWTLIDVASNAGRHGICNCEDPYFNLPGPSLALQNDLSGTMHPNSEGYWEMYGDDVQTGLESIYSRWLGNSALGLLFFPGRAPEPCSTESPLRLARRPDFGIDARLLRFLRDDRWSIAKDSPSDDLKRLTEDEDAVRMLDRGQLRKFEWLRSVQALRWSPGIREPQRDPRRVRAVHSIEDRRLPNASAVAKRVAALEASAKFQKHAQEQRTRMQESGVLADTDFVHPLDGMYNEE
ncbi:MAG: hypothetical protein DHS20C21_01000 [Gemmatimonadota bacterium]|nr:MAG: hypothetical protein DHS20C21_01000 [Gemmatimonadota bacterium]